MPARRFSTSEADSGVGPSSLVGRAVLRDADACGRVHVQTPRPVPPKSIQPDMHEVLAFRRVGGHCQREWSVDHDRARLPERRGLGRHVVGVNHDVLTALPRRFAVREHAIVAVRSCRAGVAELEGDRERVTRSHLDRGEFSRNQFRTKARGTVLHEAPNGTAQAAARDDANDLDGSANHVRTLPSRGCAIVCRERTR